MAGKIHTWVGRTGWELQAPDRPIIRYTRGVAGTQMTFGHPLPKQTNHPFLHEKMNKMKVRINSAKGRPAFSTGMIGRDNAIARHGIHGLYWLYNVEIRSDLLIKGENSIFLTQPRSNSPFQGIMYDYIRLEGPPTSSSSSEDYWSSQLFIDCVMLHYYYYLLLLVS